MIARRRSNHCEFPNQEHRSKILCGFSADRDLIGTATQGSHCGGKKYLPCDNWKRSPGINCIFTANTQEKDYLATLHTRLQTYTTQSLGPSALSTVQASQTTN